MQYLSFGICVCMRYNKLDERHGKSIESTCQYRKGIVWCGMHCIERFLTKAATFYVNSIIRSLPSWNFTGRARFFQCQTLGSPSNKWPGWCHFVISFISRSWFILVRLIVHKELSPRTCLLLLCDPQSRSLSSRFTPEHFCQADNIATIECYVSFGDPIHWSHKIPRRINPFSHTRDNADSRRAISVYQTPTMYDVASYWLIAHINRRENRSSSGVNSFVDVKNRWRENIAKGRELHSVRRSVLFVQLRKRPPYKEFARD